MARQSKAARDLGRAFDRACDLRIAYRWDEDEIVQACGMADAGDPTLAEHLTQEIENSTDLRERLGTPSHFFRRLR